MEKTSTQEEMRQYYSNTTSSVKKILDDLKKTNEQNDKELQKKVEAFISNVEKNKEKFQNLVGELEKNTEFEKFNIAFLGQTNAGKSSIIECLRILFEEESRGEQVRKNHKGEIAALKDYNKKYENLIQQLENAKSMFKVPKSSIIIPIITLLLGIAIGLGIGGFIG